MHWGIENQLHWTLMSLLQKMRLGCVLVMHRKICCIALNSLNRELSFKRHTAEI